MNIIAKMVNKVKEFLSKEHEVELVTMKECHTCHRLLPTTNFYHSIKSRDGFMLYCKRCRKIQYDSYITLDRVKKARVESRRKYYSEHKDEISKRSKELHNHSMKTIRIGNIRICWKYYTGKSNKDGMRNEYSG